MRIIVTKSKLSALLLSGIVLLGLWGNVLAASLCHHTGGKHDCCIGRKTPQHSTDEMAGLDTSDGRMDGKQMSGDELADIQTPDSASDNSSDAHGAEAFTLLNEICPHCLMHSLPNAGSGLPDLAPANPHTKQTSAPQVEPISEIVYFSIAFPLCRDHSPPGSSASRQVLINIFRI